MSSIKKPPLYLIPLAQIVVLAVTCLVTALFGVTLVYSLALGGMIQILPNVYFAVNAYRYQGARAMQQTLRAFSKGEVGKFMLTMAGFAVVFVMVKPLSVFALFSAYLFMLLIHWVVAYQVIGRQQQS